MSVLVASDLDRTLIYSAAAAGTPPPADLVTVELYEGRAISFLTATAAALLVELSARVPVVPVTTRTPAQLARVRLPGTLSSYAVAANGGVLLVDGEPDAGWTAQVAVAVGAVAPLAEAVAVLTAATDPAWSTEPRIAADLFVYTVLDRAALPAGVVPELLAWAGPAGWGVSLQAASSTWCRRR